MSIAGYLPPIVAEIVAETGKFSSGIGKAEKDIGKLEGSFKRLAAVGKVALAGLGVAAVGVGYESVKLAMNFDQTMELIHTQAGASQAEVEQLKNSVLALAPAVGIGPEKLAEGLYHIESTGMRGQAALDTLTQAAKLAQIGMADLDDVTYAMSGVMAIGMKDVHNAADAISFMNATVGMGDMRMDKLAQAIGTGILPAFKSAGLGMADFSAALATLADNSVPADEAATRLKMTVALMSAPTDKAANALASVGMTATQLADDMRKPDGLLLAVNDLKYHLNLATGAANYAGLTLEQKKGDVADFADALRAAGASSDEITAKTKMFADQLNITGDAATRQNQIVEKAFGGGRTSGAILTLLQESDKLKSKYDQMGTAAKRAKVTQEAWAQQQKQFKQQLSELVAQLQAWGVKIGNWLIPKIEELVTWINTHKEQVKVLAWVIGTVLVIAIAAYVVAMAQAAVETIVATWWILAIIAVVAALGFGIYELVKHWSAAWGWIKRTAGDAWHWIYNNVWVPFRDEFITPWITTFKLLSDMWHGDWKAMGEDLKSIFDHTIGPIINLITGGINGITDALNAMTGSDTSGASIMPAKKGHPGGGGHSAVGSTRATNGMIIQGAGHLQSYDTGGVVDGPIGSPHIAIVHGGETVTPPGRGGGGDIVIHQTLVTPDGEVLRRQTLRYARRAGLKASDVFSNAAVQGSLVRS